MCAQAEGIKLLCVCVCTNVSVLMCTFYVHVYCVYPSFMYISMCIPVCVFLFVCLDMGFVQAQEYLIPACGCVFVQTDAVW